MSQRERGMLKMKLEEEAESARRWKECVDAYLESVAQRAQSVQTAAEARALRLEVWSLRHSYPGALSVLERILKDVGY